MSGSRLLFWLQALTSAFNDSGYWSGVVICFSMSAPMIRASIAVRRMFMREVYWPVRKQWLYLLALIISQPLCSAAADSADHAGEPSRTQGTCHVLHHAECDAELRDHPRCAGLRLYLVSGAIGMFAGLLTEVIQRPLRRDASWEDVFADAVGALCALAAYALFDRRNALRRWQRVLAILVAIACITIYLAPIVTMSRAYLQRNGQFPVIAGFQSESALLWTRSVGVRREISAGALNVFFQASESPGIAFREPVPDWLSYETLAIDLENPSSER